MHSCTDNLPFLVMPSCYPRVWLHRPHLLADWLRDVQPPASDLSRGTSRYFFEQLKTPGPGWPRTPQGVAGFVLEKFAARGVGIETLPELQTLVDDSPVPIPLGATYMADGQTWFRSRPGSFVKLNAHEMRLEMLEVVEWLRLPIVCENGQLDWTRDPQLSILFLDHVYEWVAMYSKRASSISQLFDPLRFEFH